MSNSSMEIVVPSETTEAAHGLGCRVSTNNFHAGLARHNQNSQPMQKPQQQQFTQINEDVSLLSWRPQAAELPW